MLGIQHCLLLLLLFLDTPPPSLLPLCTLFTFKPEFIHVWNLFREIQLYFISPFIRFFPPLHYLHAIQNTVTTTLDADVV